MMSARLLLLAFALAAGTACAEERIEVFRLSSQQVRGAAGAVIYDVDAVERIAADLSADLPPREEEAAAIARARFAALTEADLRAIEASARALELVSRYRLTKVPAIVFDGRAIVYGVPDVEAALRIYRAWRARGR